MPLAALDAQTRTSSGSILSAASAHWKQQERLIARSCKVPHRSAQAQNASRTRISVLSEISIGILRISESKISVFSACACWCHFVDCNYLQVIATLSFPLECTKYPSRITAQCNLIEYELIDSRKLWA